jgi:TPR repeat protein
MKTPELSPNELAFRAESGDAGAQFQLGMLFLLGEGVEQDLGAAYRWFARAAEANHPGARILVQRLAAIEHQEFSARISLNGLRRQMGWRGLSSCAQQTFEWLTGKIRVAAHLPRKTAGTERLERTQKTASLVDAA